ncbi:acetyltransferase [Luteitalea sp. TBR-22]|nr:acetyltransferase [Luteitalea sp. TBR-22]
MTQADIDAGLRLCRLSRWNQTARDWARFLDGTSGRAIVATTADGHVTGSVATTRFRRWRDDAGVDFGARPPILVPDADVAWLSMVLVEPESRGQGLGTALLERGLASVADVPVVGLDATPLGRPLYEKLGFVEAGTLTRLERLSHAPVPAGSVTGVRPATPGDLAAIAVVDARATGLDRRALLAWLIEGAPDLAWVHEGPAGIDGVLLGRPGHQFTHLGPVVAPSTGVALGLLRSCLASAAPPAIVIDIVGGRASWRDGLEALGFTAQRPFTRMYRGDGRPVADPARLFAIVGPEFG